MSAISMKDGDDMDLAELLRDALNGIGSVCRG